MTRRRVRSLLERPFFQRGYIDNQLPPVIIGVLTIIGVVAYASSGEQSSEIPAAGIYLAVAVGGLGHAGWTARGGPLPELAYVLAAAIVTMVLVMAFAARRRRKRPQKRGLP